MPNLYPFSSLPPGANYTNDLTSGNLHTIRSESGAEVTNFNSIRSQIPSRTSNNPLIERQSAIATSYINAGRLYPFYQSFYLPRHNRKRVILTTPRQESLTSNGRKGSQPWTLRLPHNQMNAPFVNPLGSSRLSRSILLLLTCLICLAGGSWQLFTILDNYLKYEIISEVYYIKDDSVTPPAFSLCLPYVEVLNYKNMSSPFDEITPKYWVDIDTNEKRDRISHGIQRNLTVTDIFNLTPELTDIMKAGYVRKKGSYRIEYDNLQGMQITKYVKDDLVCYQINYEGQNRVFREPRFTLRSHHITYGQEPGIHMVISIDRDAINHLSKAVLYLHPYGQLPRGDRDFPLNYMSSRSSQLFSNSSSYIGITYYKANLNLLPAPYSTRCRNFSNFHPPLTTGFNLTFDSEYHCIHFCMRMKTLRRFNESSFTTTFEGPEDVHIMTKYSLYTDSFLEKEFDNIFDSCIKQCPGQSCQKVFFMPALVTTRESDDVTFLIYDMAGLETTANFQPKMGTVELLVQVLSVSGVWLGLSCVDIIMTFIQLVARGARNRYTQKAQSNFNRQ